MCIRDSSFSDAALAAGLGSSVVILFMHPSSRAATLRALVGGHLLAMVVGSVFTLILFSGVTNYYLEAAAPIRNITMAASVGVLIIVMALTDTEHPPAAGTVLGLTTKAWDFSTVLIVIAAVALLACIKVVLHRYLRDLL